MTQTKIVIAHERGWSCTLTSEIKTEVYRVDDAYKKRTVAILRNIFDAKDSIKAGDKVDVLVSTKSEKKMYKADVMAKTKSGIVKLHLVSGGSDQGYQETLNKIKENGRTSITR